MYILYNHDGSINKKMLNEFIQQGNSYANALFVAIIDIDPSEYELTGIATLPNGDNVTIQGGESTSLVIDGVSRPGKYLSITDAITSIPGSIKINVSATSGATVLATYTVVLTINETGLQSTDPVKMTVAEYQNLINAIKGIENATNLLTGQNNVQYLPLLGGADSNSALTFDKIDPTIAIKPRSFDPSSNLKYVSFDLIDAYSHSTNKREVRYSPRGVNIKRWQVRLTYYDSHDDENKTLGLYIESAMYSASDFSSLSNTPISDVFFGLDFLYDNGQNPKAILGIDPNGSDDFKPGLGIYNKAGYIHIYYLKTDTTYPDFGEIIINGDDIVSSVEEI